jgi:uncharacterized protein YggE
MKRRFAHYAFALAVILTAGCAARQTDAETASVFRITAEGRSLTQAERFELTLAVVSEAENVDDAVRDNNTRVAAVVTALRSMNLGDNAIRSGAFEILPEYDRDEHTGRRTSGIVRYSVTNAISVTSERLGLAGNAIEAGVNAGANEVTFLAFSLKNDASARDAALRNAVDAAYRQASVVAKAGGFSLGPIESVELHTGVAPSQLVLVNSRGGSGAFRAPTVGEIPLIPGAIATSADITIEYRIEPR